MSTKVWKWTEPVEDSVLLLAPLGARWLHVHAPTPTTLEFWAEVETSAGAVGHRFAVFGTGHEIPEQVVGLPLHYFQTVIAAPLVWHIYKVGL